MGVTHLLLLTFATVLDIVDLVWAGRVSGSINRESCEIHEQTRYCDSQARAETVQFCFQHPHCHCVKTGRPETKGKARIPARTTYLSKPSRIKVLAKVTSTGNYRDRYPPSYPLDYRTLQTI